MLPMKKTSAKGQPNRPADSSSSPGLVSTEATMNATIGAHGARLATIPSTTAVVPQEQSGVRTASSTAPTVAASRCRPSIRCSRSGPRNTVTAAAAPMLASRYGQSAATVR